MYTIYADGKLLYSPYLAKKGFGVINPKVTMEVGKAGSATFILPPDNDLYGELTKLKTVVTIYQNDEELFRGRVLDDTKDFQGRKSVYVEGELAFLLDSPVRPYAFQGDIPVLFRQLVDNHNRSVEEEKQFRVGSVTVTDPNHYINRSNSNYSTTFDEIKDKIIKTHGGFLRTRKKDNERYLDLLSEYEVISGQTIEFGVNLLDISQYVTGKDIFTCLIPVGAKIDEETGARVTIDSVNDGKDYLESEEGIRLFGKIWKTKKWDDVTIPANLYKKAKKELDAAISMNMTLDIKAVDMHIMNVDAERIKTGHKIRVISRPHGIDEYFQCTKITLDLSNPDKSVYTLGAAKKTMTEQQSDVIQEVGSAEEKAQESEQSVITRINEKQDKLTAGEGVSIDPETNVISFDGEGQDTTYTLTQDEEDGHIIKLTDSDGTEQTITIPDEDTTYEPGTGLSMSGTTINHENSVTPGTAKGDDSKTLTFGESFEVPSVTYDAQGHITETGSTTMTMPDDPATGKADNVQTFTEAATRENIASGETIATVFGKIKKFFSDLKTVAFTGSYSDLSDKPTIPTKVSELTNDSEYTTNTHKHSYTPAGSVTSTFTGMAVNTGASDSNADVSTTDHVHTFTPSGSVSSTFTGSAVNSGKPDTTNKSAVASGDHTHSVTATGSVSSTFTGTSGTIEAPASSNAGNKSTVASSDHTHSVTAAGSVSSTFTGSTVNSGKPDTTNKSVAASGDHTHNVTATGSVSSTFTGSAATSGAPSATFNVPNVNHTHSYTPAGSVSSSFSGSLGTTGSNNGSAVAALKTPTYNSTTKTLTFTTGNAAPHMHEHSFTPAGNVTSTFTGSAANSGKPDATNISAVASGDHTHSVTASGSVSSSFTGSAVTSGTPSATLNVPNMNHVHDVTAAGSVSSTFTGSSATSGTPSATINVPNTNHTHSITAEGSVSSTFTGSAATSGAPSKTTEVSSTSHTHSYTPAGSVSSTFSGTSATSGTPSATLNVPNMNHVHDVTAAGSVSSSFSGSEVTSDKPDTTNTVSVGSGTHTHSYTPSGSVSSTFTGSSATSGTPSESLNVPNMDHVHSVTAAGSVSSSFSGSLGTTAKDTTNKVSVAKSDHTHSVTAAGSVSSTFSGTEADTGTAE